MLPPLARTELLYGTAKPRQSLMAVRPAASIGRIGFFLDDRGGRNLVIVAGSGTSWMTAGRSSLVFMAVIVRV